MVNQRSLEPHVLVTGGAGYLGAVATATLLDAGFRVTVLDTLVHGVPSLLHVASHPRFRFVRGDARTESVLKPLLENAEAVFPLAAVVGAKACDRDPALARSTNVDAVRTLLRLRRPGTLVVFPTTNSGYGTTSGQVHCTEETPLEPISLYGRTKVEAERLVLEEPDTLSLRLATVFGPSPRMRTDLLVNHFVHAAVAQGYLVIFEKEFKRNFIHVRDVADCFVHCLRHGREMAGRAYNAGLDRANLSKAELAECIRGLVPNLYIHYAEIGTDPDRRNYIVSNERLRKAGFAAQRSLEDGIRELIQTFQMTGGNA